MIAIITKLRNLFSHRIIFDYVWLDGADPAGLRSITHVHYRRFFSLTASPPIKTFAGLSTNQSNEELSDCLLVPVRVYPNPFRANGKLVLAEVCTPEKQPHASNYRHSLAQVTRTTRSKGPLFGIEQEYYLTRNPGQDIFKSDTNYCGVGTASVFSRAIVARHLDLCLITNIHITGYNAEATRGQWEFQVGPDDPLTVADDLIIARYILLRLAEEDNLNVSFNPVPENMSFNMSGAHVNFSDRKTRCANGLSALEQKIHKLETSHIEAIAILGTDNERRLRANNPKYQSFKSGRLDRSAAIRIPLLTVRKNSGHFEDRRPGANINPYRYLHFLLTKLYDL